MCVCVCIVCARFVTIRLVILDGHRSIHTHMNTHTHKNTHTVGILVIMPGISGWPGFRRGNVALRVCGSENAHRQIAHCTLINSVSVCASVWGDLLDLFVRFGSCVSAPPIKMHSDNVACPRNVGRTQTPSWPMLRVLLHGAAHFPTPTLRCTFIGRPGCAEPVYQLRRSIYASKLAASGKWRTANTSRDCNSQQPSIDAGGGMNYVRNATDTHIPE